MDRKQIALEVASILVKHISPSPAQNVLENIAAELVLLVEKNQGGDEPSSQRLAVLTVLGKNHPGIVHSFSEILAEQNVDIVDINQTILHGNFAMIMIINPGSARVDFHALKNLLKERGLREDVGVFLQYEDLMRELNRI
jgi:ACT domain-containing protein